MSCTTCYPVTIPDCLATLAVSGTAITNNLEYKVVIVDHFGNAEQAFYTASGPVVTIDLDDYLTQLLNEFGEYTLKLFTGGNQVEFTIDEVIYDCIKISVQRTRPLQSSFIISI